MSEVTEMVKDEINSRKTSPLVNLLWWVVASASAVVFVCGMIYIQNMDFNPRVDCYLVKEVKSDFSDTIYSVVARNRGAITDCEKWVFKGEHHEVTPITGVTPDQREYDRAKAQWDRLNHGKN